MRIKVGGIRVIRLNDPMGPKEVVPICTAVWFLAVRKKGYGLEGVYFGRAAALLLLVPSGTA